MMKLKDFIELGGDDLLDYINKKLPDWKEIKTVSGSLEIRLPKPNRKRRVIKKTEFPGLYDIAITRSLDLKFMDINGGRIGYFWNYGDHGLFSLEPPVNTIKELLNCYYGGSRRIL